MKKGCRIGVGHGAEGYSGCGQARETVYVRRRRAQEDEQRQRRGKTATTRGREREGAAGRAGRAPVIG